MIIIFWRSCLQIFYNVYFSSKPQHRWVEDGKELKEVRPMIINDVGRKYNHNAPDTVEIDTWVKSDTWL
jgi:hypothetical protein